MQRGLPKLAALFVVIASCAGRPGSIGAILAQANADGRVTVRETPPGYPAARAGVTPGDEVLLIDGRDVRGMSPQAIHQALEGDVGSMSSSPCYAAARSKSSNETSSAGGRGSR